MSEKPNGSTRRMPTAHELRIWRDYIETSELLRRVMAGRMQTQSGISFADYSVLLALSEAEDRTMRSSELAECIGWDRSRVSHHLGRMEKRGLIHRTRCPEDSRGAFVVLSDEGLRQFRHGSVPHLRDVRELFVDAFGPEQLTAVGEAVEVLRAHLESELGRR